MSFKRDEVDLVNSYNGKTDVLLNGESDFDQIVFVLRYFKSVVNWGRTVIEMFIIFEISD